MPQIKRVFWETTGGEPEVLAPHVESQSNGGWVLQSETVTNPAGLANQVSPTAPRNDDLPSILLVGASVRWAAQSAAAGGYRVLGMDLFGDLDARAACTRFQRITSAEQDDPRQLSDSVARFATQEGATVVWGGGLRTAQSNSCEQNALTHDELAVLARNAGFRVPETIAATDRRRRRETGRWLVKEVASTGGLGIQFQYPASNRKIPDNAFLQRWIPGRPVGLVALAEDRGVSLLGVTRSMYHRCGRLPFVYAGSRTLRPTNVVPWSAMQLICEQAAERRGLRGLFNLDWIQDRQNQWWLLEINERPSASCEVLERARQHNRQGLVTDSLMQWHLSAVLARGDGSRPSTNAGAIAPSEPSSTHVKRIVYSRATGRIHLSKLARDWHRAAEYPSDSGMSPRLRLADVPVDGTPVQRGQPVATLLVDAKMEHPALAKTLRHCIDQIQASVEPLTGRHRST
ncbi:ATP-grasp domain-containing protein [Allorhodopirellula heiligendammensis]|uniref:ATP-grasp domain-containing protein n=1 Tax=Allorhodopirellula heiligendammensis TaxID=2714739 RepID=UPI00265F2CC6|nr:ATP-grasp domain-containing protein [Allorhodopirellula heiligendammensis]